MYQSSYRKKRPTQWFEILKEEIRLRGLADGDGSWMHRYEASTPVTQFHTTSQFLVILETLLRGI